MRSGSNPITYQHEKIEKITEISQTFLYCMNSKVQIKVGIPEEKQERWEDAAEVVVPLDGGRGIECEGAEQLHAHDGVDEEEHAHQ